MGLHGLLRDRPHTLHPDGWNIPNLHSHNDNQKQEIEKEKGDLQLTDNQPDTRRNLATLIVSKRNEKNGAVGEMSKRSVITTFKELLISGSKERSKEQIFYGMNLNMALLQEYLELLLELELLKVSKNLGDTYYEITPRGSAFLNHLKRLEGVDNTLKDQIVGGEKIDGRV